MGMGKLMQVIKLELWETVKRKLFNFNDFFLIPYFRRILRFFALPYCYFVLVNWKECSRGGILVICDFLYIFFILKYFPSNYSLCRLWEKDRSEWVYYYGSNYDPYQRRQLQKEVQKKKYNVLFEDKNICYQLCQAGRLPLPDEYCSASGYDEIKQRVLQVLKNDPLDKVIVKPTFGKGGAGICLCSMRDGELIVRGTSAKSQLEAFGDSSPAVLQKYIKQHEQLDTISSSINTVRIVTLLTKENDVIIIGALIRFGVAGSFVDNTSLGGVKVGIDKEKGTFMKWGHDFNSKIHDSHPTSKKKFLGLKVPMWEEVVALSKATQRHFNYFKLLGQDIAITPDGPVIIELNATYDNVGLEQATGPILKDEMVLKEYYKYGLLINDKQKVLCV